MNDNERETIKQTIKELMDILNRCTFNPDNDGAVELEKRLTDITHNLIDML